MLPHIEIGTKSLSLSQIYSYLLLIKQLNTHPSNKEITTLLLTEDCKVIKSMVAILHSQL